MGKAVSITFSEDQISELFGELAAEDEKLGRFRESFFKSDTYEQIHNERPLRILVAHKGVGKSALFRMSYLENVGKNNLALWIRPNDIADLCKVEENENALQLIEKWKKGLYYKIIDLVFREFKLPVQSEKTQEYFSKGIQLVDTISSVVREINEKIDVDATKKAIAKKYLLNNIITIYIDDLDRAWQGTKENINRIAALLNAVRDLTNESESLHFRISLRSDVYFLVRTADESTDKIEGNVIWLSWTEHELLAFLAKRVQSYLGYRLPERNLLSKPQFEIAKLLYPIMESHFMGAGKWDNKPIQYILLSLTRRRPRDLVNLCIQAAREAKNNKHTKIATEDWEAVFDMYSQNRLQDTINEHRYELPDIERLLLGMKPSHGNKKAGNSYRYTEDEIIKKVSGIIQSGNFYFSNGKKATPKELVSFLYKINFIVGRKESSDGYISRKYFEDNRYLSTDYIDFGYNWEVHAAFRWALYPESKDIFSNLDLPKLI